MGVIDYGIKISDIFTLNVETSVNVAGLLIVLAIVVSAQNDLPPPQ